MRLIFGKKCYNLAIEQHSNPISKVYFKYYLKITRTLQFAPQLTIMDDVREFLNEHIKYSFKLTNNFSLNK